MIFDPMYFVFVIPGMLLGLVAQFLVKRRLAHFSQVANRTGLSGAEVAERILRANSIYNVRIEPVQGMLSDHYDPTAKVLRLSHDVYYGRSVAAAGVAAHEVGHAIQDASGYAWLRMRSSIVPLLSFTSPLALPTLIGGTVLMSMGVVFGKLVAVLGVILFSALVVFQLVTLPVEFDASRRALVEVERGRLITGEEGGARKVLNAAALTYVAAAVSSIGQLLYWLVRLGLLGDRR